MPIKGVGLFFYLWRLELDAIDKERKMLCEYCLEQRGNVKCKLTGGKCIFVRYCPTERKIVMNDFYKKCGCKIKKMGEEK